MEKGINSFQAAMRNKELAKLGDPLTNLLYSLAQSLLSRRFKGSKVSGKVLAGALRLADLRQLAPSRLDAHGLGDCVEAVLAYTWIRGTLEISEAVTLLTQELEKETLAKPKPLKTRSHPIATAFATLLRHLWRKEKSSSNTQSQ